MCIAVNARSAKLSGYGGSGYAAAPVERDIVGGNARAACVKTAARAAHPFRHHHVAKPRTEEPNMGNLHVRIRGVLEEQSSETTRANLPRHPNLLERRQLSDR